MHYCHFHLFWIMLHCSCTSFCGVCAFCFLNVYLGMKFHGYMVILYLTFWGTTKLFPKGAVPFYTPVMNVWGLQLLLFSFYLFWIIMTILVNVKLWFFSFVTLICIFLMPNEEKAMTPHSHILAWTIPWMEEPSRLWSMGSLRVRHNWAYSLSLFTFIHWRRKWQPTPVFLPGESQGQGSLVGCHLWGCTELDTTEAT